MSNQVVDGKYKLVRKLGRGSFGTVYLAVDLTNGEEVAVKAGKIHNHAKSTIRKEAECYRKLKGGLGIPEPKWFGQEMHHDILVFDVLGPSLNDLFDFKKRKFTMKTILMLADQMITRIEYVHDKFIIHRDIKPDNFLMGVGKHCNKLYLVDFGLAKRYKDKDGQHIPYDENQDLIGTRRYTSINSHLGIEMSRRDDMETIGHCLIFFARGGRLPWQGLKSRLGDGDMVKKTKMSTTLEELCKDMPEEFITYMSYCRGLKFEEKPDYNYLRELFKKSFETLNYEYDYAFDWSELGSKIRTHAGQINSTAPNISESRLKIERREKRARRNEYW